MPAFNGQELCDEYETHAYRIVKILHNLEEIILKSNNSLEGNCFYYHETLSFCPELYLKQVNLFWCGKQAVKKICEIGFNAGHSAMLLLLGGDKTSLEFTIFDLDYHSYTLDCLKYIASEFQHVSFDFIRGDSTSTMPVWIDKNKEHIGTYDVVHVDGGHSEACIKSDFKYADILLKVNGILIVDDTNDEYINECVNFYISSGSYNELEILKTEVYSHRILQKCGDPMYIYY